MSFYLEGIDFEKHNEEVRVVWEAFNSGKPIRPPVVLGINPRIWLLNPELNVEGITFQEYSEDPDVMAEIQMKAQDYIRHNMLQDAEMGPPTDGWTIYPDFQNYYEAAWFGAKIEYRSGQVPDAAPFLSDDSKRSVFDKGAPDPCEGPLMERMWRFYEHMLKHKDSYCYKGIPAAHVNPSCTGTDGPFTIAACIRGATEICTDIYADPDYVTDLLSFITEATIQRILTFRKQLGHEMRPKALAFADDSIELLSTESYAEFVMPFHKRLIQELAGDGPHWIHLCGNVQRHMPLIKSELNVRTWDAGFPMDYTSARQSLGRDFRIHTGPRVSTLLYGSPDDVASKARQILESGIAEGGQFIMRDANNLCPCTPVENVAAMYEATREYGRF